MALAVRVPSGRIYKRRVNPFIEHGLSYLVFSLIVGGYLATIAFQNAYPLGIDAFGHLFKPWYMAEHFLRNGSIPSWMPHWYIGYSYFQYYSPLGYVVLFLFNLLTGDVFRAYYVYVFLSLSLASFFVYLIARRWVSYPAALLAGVLFLTANGNLGIVFGEGNLPRTFSMIFSAPVLGLTFLLLDRPSRKIFWWLTLSVMGFVLSHHMPAAMTMVTLSPSVLLYILWGKLPPVRLLILGAAYAVGIGLTGWWLLPATTGFDLSNVPSLFAYPERIPLYSTGLAILDPGQRYSFSGYVHLSFIGLGLVGIWGRRDRISAALALAAVTGIFLSGGANNPIYRLLPFRDSIFLPERFLQVASLALPILAAMGIEVIRKRLFSGTTQVMIAILIFVILAIDVLPGLEPLQAWQRTLFWDPYFPDMMKVLQKEQNQGRIAADPPRIPLASFFASAVGNKNQVYGWSIEGTSHYYAHSQSNLALRSGFPEYAWRLYALWNTRYAIADGENRSFISVFTTHGFEPVASMGSNVLLRSNYPSSYLMHQDRDVLVIGRGGSTLAMLFPWIAEGTSWYLEDYEQEFLSQFKSIVLYDYRYRDRVKAEEIIAKLVQKGKRVIVDYSFKEWENLFGVVPKSLEMIGYVSLVRTEKESTTGIQSVSLKPFSYEGRPWRAYSFYGLDDTLLARHIGGIDYPVIGIKNIDGGKVYFIGISLISHAFFQHDEEAISIVEGLLDEVKPNKVVEPARFAATEEAWQNEGLRFSYQVAEETPVLISMSYSPHWEATVDGLPIKLYNYEDLNMLFLPAGEHTVVFKYVQTPIGWFAIGVSTVSALGLVLMTVYFTRLWLFVEAFILRIIGFLMREYKEWFATEKTG